ncbi:rRNA adenine N-6-methyltransferase family protein [uncultured Kordia sp.]|uniref:class I SAM-dependent methyltransferase n=1 Tax=uncultured Kordia sp. TaxID=507699 RepID=UPI00260282B0|nr:rRNA adenine N-6-methyltransferase family protein [uncultured Kordia sp.]
MDRLKFFREAIRDIKTSGTIFPSSRFLSRRIVNNIDFSTVKVIVEFGPGNGIITKEILKRIQPHTKLITFEINEKFIESLDKIKHSQLIIEKVSAEDITPILKKHGYDKADCIISSLPLTNIPTEISDRILDNSYAAMEKDSLFVQYQYSLTYYKKLKEVFHDNVKLSFEAFNIPPAFVYIAKK